MYEKLTVFMALLRQLMSYKQGLSRWKNLPNLRSKSLKPQALPYTKRGLFDAPGMANLTVLIKATKISSSVQLIRACGEDASGGLLLARRQGIQCKCLKTKARFSERLGIIWPFTAKD